MAETIRESRNLIKRTIENELKQYNYTLRTSGTKNEELTKPLNPTTGYWENASSVSNKPPRWIIHFKKNIDNELKADFAKDNEGKKLSGADTLGYINNRDGRCSAALFRIMASIKESEDSFKFPNWEWVITLIFSKPLPAGTSGEILTNFNPEEGTITYSGKKYPIALLGLYKMPVEFTDIEINGQPVTYDQATEVLEKFLK